MSRGCCSWSWCYMEGKRAEEQTACQEALPALVGLMGGSTCTQGKNPIYVSGWTSALLQKAGFRLGMLIKGQVLLCAALFTPAGMNTFHYRVRHCNETPWCAGRSCSSSHAAVSQFSFTIPLVHRKGSLSTLFMESSQVWGHSAMPPL